MTDKPIIRRSLLPTKKENTALATTNNSRRYTLNVEIENDVLILRLPMISALERKVSKSGKSIICAGTGGTKVAKQIIDGLSAPIEIDGKAMRICATAWISCDKSKTSADVAEASYEEKGLNYDG